MLGTDTNKLYIHNDIIKDIDMNKIIPTAVKTNFKKDVTIIINEERYVKEGVERSTFINITETTDTPYTVLYEAAYLLVAKLSRDAQKVLFEVIFPRLRINSNFVSIKQVDAASILAIDKFRICEAFKELSDKSFIEKSKVYPYGYVINHNYFFRGNLSTFVKRYKDITKDSFNVKYITKEQYNESRFIVNYGK